MYSALHLEGPLAALGHELVLVNPENFMTYQPFLPEASSGNIEPRHVVVALRQVLHHTTVVAGEVERIEHAARRAVVRTAAGDVRELIYDHIVLGPGSLSRVLPVPGLAGSRSCSRRDSSRRKPVGCDCRTAPSSPRTRSCGRRA